MNKRKQVISIAVATAFTLTTVVNAVPAVVYAHEVDKQIELDMYGDTSADMVIDNNTEDKLVNDETIPEIESNTTDNTIDLTSSNTIWNDEKLPVLNLQTSKTTSSSATLDDGNTSADTVINNNTEDTSVNEETMQEIDVVTDNSDNAVETISSNTTKTISSDTVWNEETTLSDNLVVNPGVTLIINNKVTISGDVTISGGGTIMRGTYSEDLISVPKKEKEEDKDDKLTLRNITLDGGARYCGETDSLLNRGKDNNGTTANGALVNSGGILIIDKGTNLQNNYCENNIYKRTAAVCVTGGNAIMKGGRICNNYGKNQGAGIYVHNIKVNPTKDDKGYTKGKFIFEDGEICHNNTGNIDGGAGIFTVGDMDMTGGYCYYNYADKMAGGIRIGGRADVNIEGGEISHNKSNNTGGGIHLFSSPGNSPSITVSGLANISNNTSNAGGAIYTEGECKVSIKGNANIENNYSNSIGGAIVLSKNNKNKVGNLYIEGGKISNNKSESKGGGIYLLGGYNNLEEHIEDINILKVSGLANISNNTSKAGGAIYTDGKCKVSIMDEANIENNTSNAGGAIYTEGECKVSIMGNANIKNNYSESIGGAIVLYPKWNDKSGYGKAGDLYIEGGKISNNKSESKGGGIYLYSNHNSACNSALLKVSGGDISDNISNAGGAIYTEGECNVSITDKANIKKNSSKSIGGAILYRGKDKFSKLEITGGEICENSSESYGGGIYIWGADKVDLTGGKISENSISNDKGGGAYICMYKDLTLGDVTIKNNKLINSDNSIKYDNIAIDRTLGDNYLSRTDSSDKLHFSFLGNPIVFKPLDSQELSTNILEKIIYEPISGEKNYQMWFNSSEKSICFTKIVTNGGEIPDTTTCLKDGLAEPIKNHHIFMGWYDNESFTGNKLTDKPEACKTYYAKWEKSSYKVDDEVNFELKYNNIQAKDFTVSVNNGTPTISSVIGSNDKFTAEVDKTNKAKIVVTPASNLNVGTYTGTLTVTTGDNATHLVTVTLNITENKVPTINAQDKTLTVGSTFDPLNGVTAYDEEDGEIKDIKYNSNVDVTKPGIYTVTYEVTDSQGATVTKTITVTVEAKAKKPANRNDNEKIDYNTNNNSIAPQIITNSDGSKKIILADGTVATGWNKVNEKWYLSDANGVVEKGWVKNNNEWYYLNDNGEMQTEWIKGADYKWYYCGADGAMKTGWLKDTDGAWYHLNNSGAMSTGWLKDTDGAWYHLNNSGAMSTGWLKDINNKWYYLDNSGKMRTGWINLDNKWYYLYSDGSMAENTIIDGYLIGNDGSWINN